MTNVELNTIACLNQAMKQNSYYRTSVAYDFCSRNNNNINQCIKIQELYCYLYKHPNLIGNLVERDSAGLFDPAQFNSCINGLLQYMCNNDCTALQTITEYIKYSKPKTNKKDNCDNSTCSSENLIDNYIDMIADALNCTKKININGKIHLYKRGSGILSSSPLCIIQKKVLTTGVPTAILNVFGTNDVYYINSETVYDIINNLKNS